MEFVSFRADSQLKKQLETLASLENKKKSDEYREIFVLGMEEKFKTIAIEKYANGKLSLGKAAELANLAVWEFIGLLHERNIPMNLTPKEVLSGAENI